MGVCDFKHMVCLVMCYSYVAGFQCFTDVLHEMKVKEYSKQNYLDGIQITIQNKSPASLPARFSYHLPK